MMNVLTSVEFSAEVFFFDGLTLVVVFLASGQCYLELRVPFFIDIGPCSDYGETLLLHGLTEVSQFTLREQELTVAQWLVLAPGAPEILGNVHPLYVKLTSLIEIAEGIHERGLAITD